MARILRGDIYWANLDPTLGHEQAGRRPVMVLSRDNASRPIPFLRHVHLGSCQIIG